MLCTMKVRARITLCPTMLNPASVSCLRNMWAQNMPKKHRALPLTSFSSFFSSRTTLQQQTEKIDGIAYSSNGEIHASANYIERYPGNIKKKKKKMTGIRSTHFAVGWKRWGSFRTCWRHSWFCEVERWICSRAMGFSRAWKWLEARIRCHCSFSGLLQ